MDLAGSERLRNTLNIGIMFTIFLEALTNTYTNDIGQRLKEAGNINKSLMVLGQCMETLRHNQIKKATGRVSSVDDKIPHTIFLESNDGSLSTQ